MSPRPVALACAVLLLLASGAAADDAAPADPKKAPPAVAAEKGAFSVVLDLQAVFVPVEAVEVAWEPDVLGGEPEILEAAAPGLVEKDQVLLRLSTEKADEQIANLERDLSLARANLERERAEAARAEEASRLALERADLEAKRAAAALSLFLEKNREIRTKQRALGLKASEDGIEEDEEELAQLKKMYQADDVVEETEEIVMRRAKRNLERRKIQFDFQKEDVRQFLEIELPQEERSLRLAAAKTALDLDQARAVAPAQMEAAKIELAKAQVAAERQEKALGKARADRDGMTLRAPRAGLAVPGAFAGGKWAGGEEAARAMERRRKWRPGQVAFTIVQPGKVGLRTQVPEASVLLVRPGQRADVLPTADGQKTLEARVARVSPVAAEGGYEVLLDLVAPDERILPGFTAKLRLAAVEKADAITVPASAVSADGEKRFVHVVGEDGEAAAREVRVGARSGGRVEILDGLSPGEKVLKNAPK